MARGAQANRKQVAEQIARQRKQEKPEEQNPVAINPLSQIERLEMDLAELERAFDVFGTLDPGVLPFHHAQMFLFIAQRESCTYKELEQRFGITNASASRGLNALSEHAKHKKSSLGLIEKFIDPAEGRRYRVRLTKKGQALKRQLLNLSSND